MNFNTLKKNLKKDFSSFKKVKLALLGDSPVQFLAMMIRAQGYEAGLDIEVYEADYDRIYETVLHPTDRLYTEHFDYVVIFQSPEKMLAAFYTMPAAERENFSELKEAYFKELARLLQGNASSAKLIFFNLPEINDGVFGNFAAKSPASFLFQLRKINMAMQNISAADKNIFIADVLSKSNYAGIALTGSAKFFITSQNIFTLDFTAVAAKCCTDIIKAFAGKLKKCLILDLDNTLWGGIIGDDGIDKIEIGELGIGRAFTQLQMWAKALRERGIIIAVCSKNEEAIAREVFEKHPDMILRLSDISIFVANWDNKGDNLKYIQEVLNIGLDSMVFIDDNPFERNLVRSMFPEITVPELPADPADYLPFLRSLNLFETVSFTAEDTKRTDQYREEGQRAEIKNSFASVDEYLAGLQMEAIVEPLTEYNIGRCAQLTQRSNQFNLTTIRYSEEQLKQFVANGGRALCISLKDKFGDYGLISLCLLKPDKAVMNIDTWIMSCRVLKRGVEELAINEMAAAAVSAGCGRLRGRYIPTPKNGIVKSLYNSMGFMPEDAEYAELDCSNFVPLKNFIKVQDDIRTGSK